MRNWAFLTGGLLVLALAAWSGRAETRSLADIKAGKRVGDASASVEAGAETGGEAAAGDAGDTNGVKNVKVPAGWMRGSGPSGYERAMELQNASGLDMLILFTREDPPDEKGLCRWFEKKGLNEPHVLKQMRKYVKVRIDASQNDSRTRALVEEYKCGKTPRLVVRQPNGITKRVNVFNWNEGKQPELVKPNDLVADLKSASSPSYQTDED